MNRSELRQLVRNIGKEQSTLSGQPLSEEEFRNLMVAVGPFEASPTVAVAVSGGADSLCLALLLRAWVRLNGGEVIGLIVDHQLRPESDLESRVVQGWLGHHGINSHILVWAGRLGKGKQQAKARVARYDLLLGWCRNARVLHLALGHHRDDQAETVFFRQERASGNDGLAGMPIIREQDSIRLIRPFLAIPASRLRATLRVRGQSWMTDPSNFNSKYARSRVRKYLQSRSAGPLTSKIINSANCLARSRKRAERKTSELLARSTRLHFQGFCQVNVEGLLSAPSELVVRALSQILVSIGCKEYAPRGRSLVKLFNLLESGSVRTGYTLGGCLLRFTSTELIVCREPAAAAERLFIGPGEKRLWDRRFVVELSAKNYSPDFNYEVRALLDDGWQIFRNSSAYRRDLGIPFYAAYTLPSLWSLDGLVSVPHLHYRGALSCSSEGVSFRADYKPKRPLAGPVFQGV